MAYSGTQKVHLAKDDMITYCGWHWQDAVTAGDAHIIEKDQFDADDCKLCRRAADLLQLVGLTTRALRSQIRREEWYHPQIGKAWRRLSRHGECAGYPALPGP